MIRYPDRLNYWNENDTYRNADGFYTRDGVGSYTEVGLCRLEYSAPQSVSDGNSKKVLATSAIIYAPLTLEYMPQRGQRVKVVKTDATVHEFTVLNCERGVLHNRIWVE